MGGLIDLFIEVTQKAVLSNKPEETQQEASNANITKPTFLTYYLQQI